MKFFKEFCESPEGLQLYWKETPTQVFSCEFSKSFRKIFFIEQFWWLLLNYVLVSEKNFLKKKVSGEIAFELINLFRYKHKSLQVGQLSQSWAFVFLEKYLKQEVNDNLSICVDERSSCDLSITGDIKICQCHVIKR